MFGIFSAGSLIGMVHAFGAERRAAGLIAIGVGATLMLGTARPAFGRSAHA